MAANNNNVTEYSQDERITGDLRRRRIDSDQNNDRSENLSYMLAQSEGYVRRMLAQSRGSTPEISALGEEPEGCRHVRLTQQPKILQGIAKPYQMEGLNWLINLHLSNLNGILADEMGLGKTFQSIALLAYLRESLDIARPHLILAPKSTLGNWIKEFDMFCPKFKAFKFIGDKETRANLIHDRLLTGNFDVCITSYEICCKEIHSLSKVQWKYMIIDEAHRIKNEASKLSITVRKVKSEHRLLLTGTPLQNNLKELWALLNYLFPKIFSSAEEFEQLFNLTSTNDDVSAADREAKNVQVVQRLHKILKPFLLRRVKKDVLTEMPPKKEVLLFVPLSAMQKRLYKDILSKNVEALQGSDGSGRTILVNLAMQLRKACNHPYLFEGHENKSLDPFGEHVIENSGKVKFLDKLVKKIVKMGSRLLVFSQMTRMLDILEDYCRIRGYEYCRIDGNTAGDDRDSQIEEFNAENSPIKLFLLSTRAGGLGINLATADTVVLYDSDWNPQVDLQAMDRAHRIGQKKPVNVYRFVHEHTIEEKIIELANLKLQLDSAVIQHGRLSDEDKPLQKNDLLTMVQFGADHIFKSGNSEITDEDIDAILSRGEERTKCINEKLQQTVRKALLDFSTNQNVSLYQYDGIDYSQEDRRADRLAWTAMVMDHLDSRGEREARRRNRANTEIVSKKLNSKSDSSLICPDWQFVNNSPLFKLLVLEQTFSRDPENNFPLTEAQIAEKERLLSESFIDWNKNDYLKFVKAMEDFGKDNISSIAKYVGKPVAEVTRYWNTFWDNYHQLADGGRIVKRIEASEENRKKRNAQLDAVKNLFGNSKRVFTDLPLNFGAQKSKSVFIEEHDRWILKMLTINGIGNWVKMKQFILMDPRWKFDWVMRTRSAPDFGKRAENVIKQLSKIKDKSSELNIKKKIAD